MRSWRPIPVSALPGEEGPPTLPPDGNRVAFAWTGSAKAGQTDIYVKAVDSEPFAAYRHTRVGNEPGMVARRKPDRIRPQGVGVFIMSQLGGSERTTSDSGTIPGGTPDGKSVLIRDRVGDRPAIVQVSPETLARRQSTQP